MNTKKIMWSILLILIVAMSLFVIVNVDSNNDVENVANVVNNKHTSEKFDKTKIVVSNFASYDFLRAIIGENNNIELKFLLGPGKDSHSYDPTAQDLITIQNADLFVYVGGEMERWSDKVLNSLKNEETKIICVADDVKLIEEKEIDGAEEHEEEHEEGAFNEHIWTSPENAIIMINSLEKVMEEIDPQNKDKYLVNAQNYIEKIKELDKQIQEIVDNKVRNRLVFGDKMPMQYFMEYYGIEVSAAFKGCSTETDPSSKTIAYLVSVAKNEETPVILYIELNNGKVASTIANEVANETGRECIAMQIQTLHNVSKDDFDNGETWVSLMERNIDVLKKALQ